MKAEGDGREKGRGNEEICAMKGERGKRGQTKERKIEIK